MSCCSVSIALEKLKGRSSQPTWIDLVKAAAAIDANDTNKIKGKTCKIYNRESRTNNSNDVCTCNRLAKRHSYDGKCMKADVALTALELANGVIFTSQTALDCCGVLPSGCKFIRCSEQTPPKLLYPLILADCGNKKPSLIISVYGGAKYFMLTEKLEKEFMRGIVDVATIADAWILTAGLNNGVSKLVGEGISQYRLLKQYPKEVVCIGLTLWGSVSENTRIELKKANQTNSFNKEYERQLPENAKDNRETVDRHHTHCVLFDSGKLNEYLGDGQRSNFVKHICDDKNGDACYAVTIIVEGGSNTPQIVQFDIDNDRPVVVIRGSGRMADVLSNLIELTTNSNKDEQRKLRDDEIEKTLKASFPELVDDALSTCIGELKRIFNSGKRHLLHVFRLDRDVNVAETIFKAIFSANRQKRELQEKPRRERRASISATPSNSELEQERKVRKLIDLALRWNYLDGVKQLVDFQKLVAISSESMHVLKTACFHEALNHVWYDRLAASNNHASAKPFLLLSILLAGLPAPFVIQYRQKDDRVLPFKHNKLCKMTERHSFTGLNILSSLTALFNVLPYGLFYMGIGFRYGSGNNELLFTVARILLALDLEVWYLQSLKFAIALKSLGPKLFMLKNMLPNLFEFLYIASVAIAAYGVVSRSLFKYNQVAFDGKGIFREIFYRPYWFLYGQVSDTADLETLIESANSTVVAEATATQVLLAFHMLFINILLLTLLIAVFTDTIGKVQHNTEFYWDYQRYSFVREYFDRPALAYPPLIVFPHFFRVGHFTWQMCRKFCCKKQQVGRRDDQPKYDHCGSYSPVLKIIAAEGSMLDEHWNMFESAATYSYARSSIEQKNKSTDDKNYFGNKTSLSKEYVQPTNENMNPTGIERQQEANIDLKEEIKSLRSTMIEMQIQLNKINQSLRWIMDAIERVKMNSKTKSRPDENISSKLSDVPTLNAQAQE
ncbi:unnamed protein product [Rotaria socialis]|uniref:Uncharacterized protein n=1 Tax=Rotaria socialis TaxID=392032 RepID=A0A818NMV6_9BILA|nr:unnamed protein product [Rotaria socialis]